MKPFRFLPAADRQSDLPHNVFSVKAESYVVIRAPFAHCVGGATNEYCTRKGTVTPCDGGGGISFVVFVSALMSPSFVCYILAMQRKAKGASEWYVRSGCFVGGREPSIKFPKRGGESERLLPDTAPKWRHVMAPLPPVLQIGCGLEFRTAPDFPRGD